MDTKSGAASVESLVFECLERIEADGDGALEAVCSEHADHAQELRERIALLRRMGLHGVQGGAGAIPERLGDFRLIERLGIGGMGVVYLAEQVSLRRPVALKLIRPEQLYFANARERFQREIDAIARLQHPSIVPIHATGEEGGIPYYAMEHVRGASLAQVIASFAGRDPARITGADLLELVVAGAPRGADPAGEEFVGTWSQVATKIARALALAVQHAHERGVLHRDIKPSNVMIAADGRVVLLDFGLASLSSTGALTRTGSQIGSLPYMAPEQLRAQIEHIDARTDVYGIGVTLYEMLALAPAYLDPGDTEVLRARILEARPRALKDVHHGISTDLARVCATAMHPEPVARYASAALFAADLENVLALRPIAARAPSTAARLRSWSRRNPARATAAALAVALVVGGPSMFALQQRAANDRVAAINVDLENALHSAELDRERADLARAQADHARERAELDRERADVERAAADRNLHKAVDAVDTMLTRVGQDTLHDVPQMVSVRRDLLEDALGFYAEFLEEREGDPQLRRTVELARMRVSAMHVTLGDLDEAGRELELLVESMRVDAERPDADASTLHAFADIVSRLGDVRARNDEHAASEARLQEAIAVHDRIPSVARTANSELQRATCFDKLGDLEQRRGRMEEAEQAVARAVEIARDGSARFPDHSAFQLALGRYLDRLGTLRLRRDPPTNFLEPLLESVALLESYRELEPGSSQGRTKLASASINLANALESVGRSPESRARSEIARELGETLVRDYPDVPAYGSDLAIANLQLFIHAYNSGDLESAERFVLRAAELQEGIAHKHPTDSTFHVEIAGTCRNLAALQDRLGKFDESLESSDRGLEHLEKALAASPNQPQWIDARRAAYNNRGSTLLELGRWREAADCADILDDGGSEVWCSRRAYLREHAARLAADDVELEAAVRVATSRTLRESALADLERAVDLGRTEWPELENPDAWKSVREDPRFVRLIERSRPRR